MMATERRRGASRPAVWLAAAAAAAALLTVATVADAAYIERIDAKVDGPTDAKSPSAAGPAARKHEPFVPLVAFQCGYRSKFIDRDGKWRDDANAPADGCKRDKYDILKYCKHVYPSLDVTNVVEYAHESRIGAWCRDGAATAGGGRCADHFNVRPYRCIVGEFVSESLQVPPRCRFSHINGRGKCNDYKFWSLKAESECGLKTEDETHQSMKLHSFSILDPCGLGMFRGVEFVCCPKSVEDKMEHIIVLDSDKTKHKSADEEYDDEDEDDEEDGDDDETAENEKSRKGSGEEDAQQDPYFKAAAASDGVSERERFHEAEERLEKRHRKKVTKVITQWSELFERYNKMKIKDPHGAEEYKRVMTARFRKTVAALEEENREQRTQLEELHDERVQSALNEKKRQATHDYRAALARQVGGSAAAGGNKNNVLRTLKNYVKAEERDRTHMLNRYRRLLRSDPEAAVSFEPILFHRLRYIDLRINGTLAMLHDFPRLERQVRPLAQFWEHYRRENTPEAAVADEAARAASGSLIAGGEDANERLIHLYKNAYQRDHPEAEAALRDALVKTEAKLAIDRTPIERDSAATAAKLRESAPRPSSAAAATADARRTAPLAVKQAAPTTQSPAITSTLLPEDSDEDQFDDDEEDEAAQEAADATLAPQLIDRIPTKPSAKFDKKIEKIIVKPSEPAKEEKKVETAKPDDEDDEESSDDDDDDSDSDSEEDESADEADEAFRRKDDLSIDIEPIHDGSSSYSRRHDALVAYNLEYGTDGPTGPLSALAQFANRTNVALGMFGCALVILIAGILLKRRAARHPGFVEVDVCTPEERHLAGLQVNGYENPTYAHFDAKA